MSLNGSDVAAYYGRQDYTLRNLIERHRQLVAGIAERDKALEQQQAAARRELASTYLPSLTDESLARVARLTGFQGFERRDPRAAIAHERKVIATTVAGIEASENFVRRDDLVGPAGTLTQELDNARDTLAPLEAECARFENLPSFKELIEIGYDTPRFSEKWWKASYWKHWAAGDKICKALDLNDFGDEVIPAYNKVSEPRNFMLGEVARFTKAIDDVHGLVRERDRLVDRNAHLEEIFLAEAQDFLGEHLASADAALLEEWASKEPEEQLRAIQIGLRKVAGLGAKREFLQEIGSQGIPQTINQLELRRRKAQAKVSKFSRPKHAYAYFPDGTIDPGFDQKAQSMNAQVDKLEKRVDHLMASQRYEGFDLRQDHQMWWLYFMNQPPPRYAPTLFGYYEQHPGVTVTVDPDFVDMQDPTDQQDPTAQAFIAGDQEQDGYLS